MLNYEGLSPDQQSFMLTLLQGHRDNGYIESKSFLELETNADLVFTLSIAVNPNNLIKAAEKLAYVLFDHRCEFAFYFKNVKKQAQWPDLIWDGTDYRDSMSAEQAKIDHRGRELKFVVANTATPEQIKATLQALWRCIVDNNIDVGYVAPAEAHELVTSGFLTPFAYTNKAPKTETRMQKLHFSLNDFAQPIASKKRAKVPMEYKNALSEMLQKRQAYYEWHTPRVVRKFVDAVKHCLPSADQQAAQADDEPLVVGRFARLCQPIFDFAINNCGEITPELERVKLGFATLISADQALADKLMRIAGHIKRELDGHLHLRLVRSVAIDRARPQAALLEAALTFHHDKSAPADGAIVSPDPELVKTVCCYLSAEIDPNAVTELMLKVRSGVFQRPDRRYQPGDSTVAEVVAVLYDYFPNACRLADAKIIGGAAGAASSELTEDDNRQHAYVQSLKQMILQHLRSVPLNKDKNVLRQDFIGQLLEKVSHYDAIREKNIDDAILGALAYKEMPTIESLFKEVLHSDPRFTGLKGVFGRMDKVITSLQTALTQIETDHTPQPQNGDISNGAR